jgi:DNA-binding beta-propeller fold protein YncE
MRTALTSQLTNQVILLDTADPPDVARIGAIEVGAAPWHPVFTPDGNTLYVPEKDANRITAIDMQALSVSTVIEGPGLAEPHGSTIRPDGKYLYVSNRNTRGTYQSRYDFGSDKNVGTLVVVDTETNQIVKVLELEEYPAGLPILY